MDYSLHYCVRYLINEASTSQGMSEAPYGYVRYEDISNEDTEAEHNE